MAKWVNFAELRDRLEFVQVLESYGVDASVKGQQVTALCPLPEHNDCKTKSFSANLERGIWQCFGCHAKGNVLDFCVRMEGFDPSDANQFREGALKAQERFDGRVEGPPAQKATESKEQRQGQDETLSDSTPEANVQRVINAPLDFELKSIDVSHPYIQARGLTKETVDTFGLGFCNRGLMKGRMVIPLHDDQGQLIGYAGRMVDNDAIDDEHPKYLLPGKREVNGVQHEFWKSEFLFNGHRIDGPLADLIVVEGFVQAMWLHQCGFPAVVAVMGSAVSEKQASLICRMTRPDARIYLLPDGDEAGDRMASEVLPRLAQERWVRHLRLPGGNDADSISAEGLQNLLGQVGL